VRERRQATEGSAGRCECTIGAKPRSFIVNADSGNLTWCGRTVISDGNGDQKVGHWTAICRLKVSLLSEDDVFESARNSSGQPAGHLALLTPFLWPEPVHGLIKENAAGFARRRSARKSSIGWQIFESKNFGDEPSTTK